MTTPLPPIAPRTIRIVTATRRLERRGVGAMASAIPLNTLLPYMPVPVQAEQDPD